MPAAGFDVATLVHVGMNIQDKPRLCAEVARVLRPGGRFAIYDVMRKAEGPLTFPLPWATDETASFVETPAAYRQALAGAGFTVLAERDRREAGLAFFARMREREAAGGPPQLSPPGRAGRAGQAPLRQSRPHARAGAAGADRDHRPARLAARSRTLVPGSTPLLPVPEVALAGSAPQQPDRDPRQDDEGGEDEGAGEEAAARKAPAVGEVEPDDEGDENQARRSRRSRLAIHATRL